MGLFGFRQSTDDKRAEEVRTGTRAPDRSERRRCWEARDGYFRCLDGAGIIDPLKEDKAAARACPGEGAVFERDCAAQWVTHFKKYRLANYQKEQRLKALEAQGANRIDIDSGPGTTMPAPKRS